MHASTRVRTGSGAVMETAAAPSARPLTRRELAARERLRARRSLTAAGVLLGIGLGGFVDGIVLHQIVQWHQMLSAVLPPDSMEAMKRNMAADGWFHAAVWIATLAGVLMLWQAVRGPGPVPATRHLLGNMLLGWGAFNF